VTKIETGNEPVPGRPVGDAVHQRYQQNVQPADYRWSGVEPHAITSFDETSRRHRCFDRFVAPAAIAVTGPSGRDCDCDYKGPPTRRHIATRAPWLSLSRTSRTRRRCVASRTVARVARAARRRERARVVANGGVARHRIGWPSARRRAASRVQDATTRDGEGRGKKSTIADARVTDERLRGAVFFAQARLRRADGGVPDARRRPARSSGRGARERREEVGVDREHERWWTREHRVLAGEDAGGGWSRRDDERRRRGGR